MNLAILGSCKNCSSLVSNGIWRSVVRRNKPIDRNKKTKTYNRRDSQMVTHSSTSRPVQCLCMAERTELSSVTSETKI
jgi:hypothetical protein